MPTDLSDELAHAKCEMFLDVQQPTLLIGWFRRGEPCELTTSLKSMQVSFKPCERQREEGRCVLHALPAKSNSWHEKFVQELASEEYVETERVIINSHAETERVAQRPRRSPGK